MDRIETVVVDLQDPETLDRIIEEYLRFGACPVDRAPFPGLLRIVTLVLRLPDGTDQQYEAQVVLRMQEDRYVVQLQEPVDLGRLRALVQVARRAARVRGGKSMAGAVDRPFEGAVPPRRRDRHLPKPDRSGVTSLKTPVRPTNPPPRIVRKPKG